MKNNTKKAPVKFRDDLLYFQHFMLIFVLSQIVDYHHLKMHEFNVQENSSMDFRHFCRDCFSKEKRHIGHRRRCRQ